MPTIGVYYKDDIYGILIMLASARGYDKISALVQDITEEWIEQNTKKCSKCGKITVKEAKYCNYCGAELEG